MIEFREKKPGDAISRAAAPNLTPLIDILFILLVFFILTAGTVFHAVTLNLPSLVAPGLSPPGAPNIVLEIRKNSYALDGRTVANFEALKSALSGAVTAAPDRRLVVAADKSARLEEFLKALSYLQSQGIEAVDILAREVGQE